MPKKSSKKKEKLRDLDVGEDEGVEVGIEDSIRRCEALLACKPLSFMPGSSTDAKTAHLKPRRNLARLKMEKAKQIVDIDVQPGACIHAPDDCEWNKNMGLLSQTSKKGRGVCLKDEVTCPRSGVRVLTIKTIPVENENISVTKSHFLSFQCGSSPEGKDRGSSRLLTFGSGSSCFGGSPRRRAPDGGDFETSSNSSSRIGGITLQNFPMPGEITSQSTTLDIINMATKKGTLRKRVSCLPFCGVPGADDSSSSDDWTLDGSSRAGVSSQKSCDPQDKTVDVKWTSEKSALKAVKDGVEFHLEKEYHMDMNQQSETTCMSFSTVIGRTASATWKSCIGSDCQAEKDGGERGWGGVGCGGGVGRGGGGGGGDGGDDDSGGKGDVGDGDDEQKGFGTWKPLDPTDQFGCNLHSGHGDREPNPLRCTCKIHVARSKRQSKGDRCSRSVPKEWIMGPGYKKYETVVIRERLSGEERIKYLATPRTDMYKKFAQLKEALDNQEFLNECSFKPKIVNDYRGGIGSPRPMLERAGNLQKVMEERKRARMVNEKEAMDMLSFWPQTNTEYDHVPYQPIHERTEDWQQRRMERLELMRKRTDIAAGCTFHPQINRRSIRLFKQRGYRHITFQDRLLRDVRPSVHEECKSHKGECYTNGKYQCTFAPVINKNTNEIVWKSKEYGSCPDFFSRQRRFVESHDKKVKEKEQLPKDATFTPKISDCDAILRKSTNHLHMMGEGPTQRWERLSVRDKDNHDQHLQTIADAVDSKFKYRPEIDEVSRLLGRQPTIDLLHKNEKATRKKAGLMLAAKAAFDEKFSFQPQMNPSSLRVIKDRKTMEMVRLRRHCHREEKARRQRLARVLKELQEVRECTFQPIINSAPRIRRRFVVIKGLERHLELQRIAKQMKREQDELEKKLFMTHAIAFPARQYTIPKPFVFHTQLKSQKYSTRHSPDGHSTSDGCILGCKQGSCALDLGSDCAADDDVTRKFEQFRRNSVRRESALLDKLQYLEAKHGSMGVAHQDDWSDGMLSADESLTKYGQTDTAEFEIEEAKAEASTSVSRRGNGGNRGNGHNRNGGNRGQTGRDRKVYAI